MALLFVSMKTPSNGVDCDAAATAAQGEDILATDRL